MTNISFRKTGKVSGMCNEYMELEYKDLEKSGQDTYIFCENDALIMFVGGIKIGIHVPKEDKKRFQVFISDKSNQGLT